VDTAPGTTTVRVPIDARAFRHHDGSGWAVEPGPFTVHAGFSVTDTPLTGHVAPGLAG
jgi:beta-glucosidase